MNHSSFSGADHVSGILGKRKHVEISEDDDDDDLSVTDDSDDRGVSRYLREEIDLEVAIRERLATTIEGRIQWALLLLDSLARVDTNAQAPDADEFQDAALDAYEALEAPSTFLFESRTSEEESEPSPRSFSPLVTIPQQSQRVSKTRSSRTPKPSNQKKLLYIRLPSGTSDSQLAVLACPTCTRTQFSTLQGLLNHARLAHGVEWASHDACITACAVPTNPDDVTWETIGQDGIEVPWGGNVVGLRRLFERAVGVDGNLPTPVVDDTIQTTSQESAASIPSTLLSRTLGLHADSPSLAPFLGRAPKRRCIHAYNEEEDVDIVTVANGTLGQAHVSDDQEHHATRFHMVYPHRNAARAGLDLVVDVDTVTGMDTDTNQTTHAATLPVTDSSASRFHITARVRLEDRSLYLTEERRLGSLHQYRWMLGVTSPSYSLPLASFLTRVKVIPPASVSHIPLSVQQQPFAVFGTANEPFLARVVMEWTGGGKMEVEHWVDLDQSKSGASVAGSEQMLDVELDRNTPLLPVPGGHPPSLPALDRYSSSNAPQAVTSELASENTSSAATAEDSYETILQSLLPRVPMTAKDVKSRINPSVPYKLVANPAQLLALIPGRRKAIEWGRARALHALYVEYITSPPSPGHIPLTVGDVYAFLEDASLFPRPSTSTPAISEVKKKGKEKAKEGTPAPGEEACPVCGIKKRLHPGYAVKHEEGTVGWTCPIVPPSEQQRRVKFPLIDLTKMFALPAGLERAIRDRDLLPRPTTGSESRRHETLYPAFRCSPRDLMTFSSPDLILAVQKSVEALHLPRFPSFPLRAQHPAFLDDRERTEQSLAPSALLSVTLRPFISILLRSALEVAKRDVGAISGAPSTVTGGGKTGRPKKGKKVAFVLTPGHILRGLRLPAPPEISRPIGFGYLPGIGVKEAVSLCLTRVGVPLHFGRDGSVTDHCQGSGGADLERSEGPGVVKLEPV